MHFIHGYKEIQLFLDNSACDAHIGTMVYYLSSPEWWVWVFWCCNWAILSDHRLPLSDLTVSSAVLVLMFHQKMSSFKEYGYTFKVDCFWKNRCFLEQPCLRESKEQFCISVKNFYQIIHINSKISLQVFLVNK